LGALKFKDENSLFFFLGSGRVKGTTQKKRRKIANDIV
jgi:hypothetical protein